MRSQVVPVHIPTAITMLQQHSQQQLLHPLQQPCEPTALQQHRLQPPHLPQQHHHQRQEQNRQSPQLEVLQNQHPPFYQACFRGGCSERALANSIVCTKHTTAYNTPTPTTTAAAAAAASPQSTSSHVTTNLAVRARCIC